MAQAIVTQAHFKEIKHLHVLMAHPASSSIEEMAANSSYIISDGAHLTDGIALTLVECREILEEATAKEEQAQTQEQTNALKAMITDMDQKPQKSRIREMAKLLNVPQETNIRT